MRVLLRRAMPSYERMGKDERRKYLKLVAPRYVRADEEGLSRLHVSLDCAGLLASGEEVLTHGDLRIQRLP